MAKVLKMKKLTTQQRDKLPASAFGLPGSRKYPIDVPGQKATYAQAAKKRAAQQESMGNLSSSGAKKITRKAVTALKKEGFDKGKAKKSPAKGRSKLNIDEALDTYG